VPLQINHQLRRTTKVKATESRAVAIARAHCEAWTNHDYEAARRSLAPDVKVTATSTQEGLPVTDLKGADDYMKGLILFGDMVKPGSLQVNQSIGDERNALLMVTVRTEGPPFGSTTLAGARLYLLDDDNKIKSEQVVFYMVPD
jgi:SnoaL-like domain